MGPALPIPLYATNGRNRRILLLAAHPGEGRLPHPTAAVQTWRPELVSMPQSRLPRPRRLSAASGGEPIFPIRVVCDARCLMTGADYPRRLRAPISQIRHSAIAELSRTWLLRDTERYQPNDDFGIRAPVSKST